ncbi:MAG: GntR family transcriptional regulator [Lachnospiraceae bacterium]
MISLNYRDSRPIYEQVKDGFRNHIVQQVLTADEKIPSVRELASQLSINPNTISRAYRELETEGYIYSVSGKGTFVAPREQFQNPRKLTLLAHFDEITKELFFLNTPKDELITHIQTIAQGGKLHD